ncbi:MAG: helix-turn-helix transcriptional regulator [Thermaurantiacus sp.]
MENFVTLQIRQFGIATFRAVTSDHSALIRVWTGLKRLERELGAIEIAAGSLAVMPPRVSMTIENRPTADEPYTAQLLIFPDDIVQSVRQETGMDGNPMRVTSRGRALSAFDRAAAYARDRQVPDRLKAQAVREVLLWLAEEGIGFGSSRPITLKDRLRVLFSADTGREWHAADAARALAVSEPTLRRHLAAEGTSFRELLSDVRMSTALGVLQTTDLPVNRIALDVGYASPSRFAIRFRKRFGLSPSSIRVGDHRLVRPDAR